MMKNLKINKNHCIGGWYIDTNVCDEIIKIFQSNKSKATPGQTAQGVNKSVKESLDLIVPKNHIEFPFNQYRLELQKCLNEYLKVYASIQDQTAYYEAFDTDFKMLSKELKKLIKDFHKPPKLKKLNNNTHHHKSNKRGRPSKKNQLLSTQHDDDLISSIVTAAFDNMNHYTPPLLQRTSS